MNNFTMGVLPVTATLTGYLGAAFWGPAYYWSVLCGVSCFYRVRDKVAHPEVDELLIKDYLYDNETVKEFFHD